MTDLTARIHAAIEANFVVTSEATAQMAADRLNAANPAIDWNDIYEVALTFLTPKEEIDPSLIEESLSDRIARQMHTANSDY